MTPDAGPSVMYHQVQSERLPVTILVPCCPARSHMGPRGHHWDHKLLSTLLLLFLTGFQRSAPAVRPGHPSQP